MRKHLYFITIPEDHLNVDLLEVLRPKLIIKDWLVVKHEHTSSKPHYHILIELYNSLERNTVRLWFKTYMHWVEQPLGDKSELIAYMLDQSQCVKVIGAKNEKKAL